MPQKKAHKLSAHLLTFDPRRSLKEDVEEVARLGIPGITLTSAKLDPFGFEKGRQLVRDAGLKVPGYTGINGWGGPGEFKAKMDEGKRRIEEAAKLGAEFLLVKTGPRGNVSYQDACQHFREGLQQLAPVARAAKVALAVEPSHPMSPWFSFVFGLYDTLDLTRGIDGVGALLDTFHCWWDPRLLDDIRRDCRRILNVQVSDYARPTKPVVLTMGGARCAPGEGLIPLREIFDALDAAGYDHWYDIEVIDDFPPERRKTLLADCKRWFDKTWV